MAEFFAKMGCAAGMLVMSSDEGQEVIRKELLRLAERSLEGHHELDEKHENCEDYHGKGIIAIKHVELQEKSGTSDQN